MTDKFFLRDSSALRKKVARAAAFLLYSSEEKEYKQAKIRAARDFGTRIMPINREVAEQLDIISGEREGLSRLQRLAQMRREALEIMSALGQYSPKLVGSVWRGTVHRNSDIDIAVYASNPKRLVTELNEKGFTIKNSEFISAPSQNGVKTSFHIYIETSFGVEAEIVVRSLEEITEKVKCEICGDIVKGLDLDQLNKVLREDPLRRFSSFSGTSEA